MYTPFLAPSHLPPRWDRLPDPVDFLPPLEAVAWPRRRQETQEPTLPTFVQSPKTFEVEEVAASEWTGEGEHWMLWLRKEGQTTQAVAKALQTTFGLREEDIGYSGQKDRHATAFQWFSVRGISETALGRFSFPGVTILRLERDQRRLRIGHLRGNRFRLRLPTLSPHEGEVIQERLIDLRTSGLPNYFGPQRFGKTGKNAAEGKALLRQETFVREEYQRRLFISAWQAAFFNSVVAWRLRAGLFDSLLQGDLLWVEGDRRPVLCRDPEAYHAAALAGKACPTGWMPGSKVAPAQGLQGQWETALFEQSGLHPDSFRVFGSLCYGTRRPLGVSLSDLTCEITPTGLLLSFFLPSGTYASTLLAQIGMPMSSDAGDDDL